MSPLAAAVSERPSLTSRLTRYTKNKERVPKTLCLQIGIYLAHFRLYCSVYTKFCILETLSVANRIPSSEESRC